MLTPGGGVVTLEHVNTLAMEFLIWNICKNIFEQEVG